MTTTVPEGLENVNFSDVDIFADGPPHHIFEQMRKEAPVLWNPPTDDNDGFWSVTRHEDDAAITADWEGFSSARRGIFIQEEGIIPKEFARHLFSMMDPPEHDKHRAILGKVFTPKAVLRREPDIRGVITRLIDGVIERGSCDFVSDVAVEFPLAVTANMLGVPEADRAKLFEWTNTMADTQLPPEAGQQMMGQMAEFLMGLIAERRANPAEDLLSRLIHAEVDGEKLNDVEIMVHFAQLMAGGNETTRNAFSGGLHALLERPEQWRRLAEEPGLIDTAVEEVLRWHTPIMHNVRTATRDTEIRGVPIEEGQRVALWRVSSNRDEAVFDKPGDFDIARTANKHVSFSGGRHYCLGNQLARLELRICLPEVMRRMADLQLAGPVTKTPNNTFHWMQSMPVEFTPGPPSGGAECSGPGA